MKYKDLATWCKWLEKNFSPEIMIPTLPVIIRLDANNFSSWTKGLKKPFDSNLSQLMTETAIHLLDETNALVAYTQSDEITLILYSDDKETGIYNDGKKQKILSKLTAECVNFFNDRRKELLPNHNKFAKFDCRIYQTPTLHDATLQLLWRENDASKNSIFMLASSLFSHKSLQGLNGNDMQDKMMLEKNVNWNNLDIHFKRGTYVRRIKTTKAFTTEELDSLPENHNARKNPNLIIERNVVSKVDVPPFKNVVNKVDFVFYGENPLTKFEKNIQFREAIN